MNIFLITFCFMTGDIITGLANAIMHNTFESKIMREGLFHKFGSVVVIVLSEGLEIAGKHVDLNFPIPLMQTVCGLIILMEVGSILENVTKLNPDFQPEFLQKIFGQKQ